MIVTVPGNLHVASPRLVIDTTATFDDDHETPSPTVSSRLWLLVKFPLALKPTWPCELVGAVALAGVTVMLVMVGWPAPHPMMSAAATNIEVKVRNFAMKN